MCRNVVESVCCCVGMALCRNDVVSEWHYVGMLLCRNGVPSGYVFYGDEQFDDLEMAYKNSYIYILEKFWI